ncbi:MAG: EAL domain-containing protein [Pseudobutyrivibrio sp.]|nr:EAL domain-containing protein [Pseudobutyrivibrio sp.]
MENFNPKTSEIDGLLGLSDRETFYNFAQNNIKECAGHDRSYAIAYFDIENFKIFNDNFGYSEGDKLLADVAKIIKETLDTELAARLHDDHFVACASTIGLVAKIKDIHTQIRNLKKKTNVEIKAGLYVPQDNNEDINKCVDKAKTACISIKNCYDIPFAFYNPEMGGKIKRRQFILDNLDMAIEKGYIQPYYQPIVRSLTGKVCGWETLVRWIDPEQGMIYPNEFISVLEETRLIHKLDKCIIESVAKDYQKIMNERGNTEPVSINLSRIDFELLDLVNEVEAIRKKYNVPADMMHFEITESIVMKDPNFINEKVEEFRDLGYEVWMDDFGSGFSSLNLLKNFDFDMVKIDMNFLSDFDTNEKSKVVLNNVISMVKELGIHTLAEGVETKEQYEYLKSIGCEKLQGFFISRPMKYLECYKYLETNNRAFESLEEREYYDEIGKVDILGQNPLHNINRGIYKASLPLAVIEEKNGHISLLNTNSSYDLLMKEMNPDYVENSYFSTGTDYGRRFLELCHECKLNESTATMDYIFMGYVINHRVAHISYNEAMDSDAYIMSLRVDKRYTIEDWEQRINASSRQIFSFFECIDLFGLDGDYFENLYLDNSSNHVYFKDGTANEVLKLLLDTKIYKDDKEKFARFMDLNTMRERFKMSGESVLVGYFRIMNSHGKYMWKIVRLTLSYLHNNELVMSCVIPCDKETEEILNERYQKNTNNKDYIEKTKLGEIIDSLPFGIFWKDINRRFIGANKMFLDYYGFESVDEILGKNDEDMGWHINPEAFKKDELRVIELGKSTKNVPGECIVHGEIRKIRASKQPLYLNNEIVGLMGYFVDVTDDLETQNDLKELSITDELTGVYNKRGFNDIIAKYMDQYEIDRTDFAMIMVDIDDFKLINDMYGHGVGDKVLKEVCRALKIIAAESSVIIRYGGDEFVILHQFKDKSEIDDLISDINVAIGNIKMVDDTNIKICTSTGMSLYSKVNSLEKLINIADERMYETKKIHKKKKLEGA